MTASADHGLQRIDDLAASAGTTPRNIRVYQERGLLPPPVRRGRTAYYGPRHAERLALILRLLDRGYTFATIGELLLAERHGLTLADLLRADTLGDGRRRTGRRRGRGATGLPPDFEMPDNLVDQGTSIGLVSTPGAHDHFFADTLMVELFSDLLALGVGEEGVDAIGRVFMDGQSTAAEALDILVRTLREAGMEQAVIEKRVDAIMHRAGAAARTIFLSAARTLLADRHGFPAG